MLRKYGFFGLLGIVRSLLFTKIIFKSARLIRLPIDIRNRRYINFGKKLTTGKYCRIEAYPVNGKKVILSFGYNVQLNDFVHITARENVKIGDNVLIASKVYISDCSHGSYKGNDYDSSPKTIPIDRELYSTPIIIEDNVWIGEFVSILPGVKIGKGSIIGSNSVVSRDIPDFVIAVGSPARPIKKFNFKENRWEKIK